MRIACWFILVALAPSAAICAPSSRDKWAVMVYMSAKNNLECDALADFAQLAMVGGTADIDVWVELGRPRRHACDIYRWDGVRRFHVLEGTTASRGAALDRARSDMGKGSTVAEFVDAVMKRSGANHFILILWGHGLGFTLKPPPFILSSLELDGIPGFLIKRTFPPQVPLGGFLSFGFDQDRDSYLHIRELEDALKHLLRGKKLDVIAFDACLMGTIENAYAFRDVADFMVASEQLLPPAGWSYAVLLKTLANGGLGKAHAANIVRAFALTHAGVDCQSTLTAVDLGQALAVGQQMSKLASALKLQLADAAFVRELSNIRDPLASYGGPGNDANSIDSRLFVDNLLQSGLITPATRAEAVGVSVLLGLGQSLVAHYAPDHSGSNGLSIYFPKSLDQWNQFPFPGEESYDPADCGHANRNGGGKNEIEFVCQEKWSDFLEAYVLASNTK